MSDYRIEVFCTKAEKWAWRIRHKNRRILAMSEEYERRTTALRIAGNLAKAIGLGLHEINR